MVHVLSQLDEDDEWEIVSIHKTGTGAKTRLDKIADEEQYDQNDVDRYLAIEEFKMQE